MFETVVNGSKSVRGSGWEGPQIAEFRGDVTEQKQGPYPLTPWSVCKQRTGSRRSIEGVVYSFIHLSICWLT